MKYENYIDDYKEYMEYIGKSEVTVETYLNNCKWFFNSIDKDVEDIKKSDINRFMMEYKKTHSHSSLELIINSLSSFFKVVAEELELIEENPVKDIKLPKRKVEQNHHMALTKDEIMGIIRQCKNSREKAMIMLMFQTGVRFKEIANLTLEQYNNRDEDNGILLVETKGGKPRMIYLSNNVCKVIDEYISTIRKDGEWLFVSNTGKKMERKCMSNTLKVLAKRSGLSEEKVIKISNHCLRASYASYLLNETNTPISLVSASMGHSDISTGSVLLKHYYNIDNNKVENIMTNII